MDNDITTLPGPLVIVCMDKGEINENFINHSASIQGVLAVWIDDSPDAVLPDQVLVAFVDGVISLLKEGISVYVHCAAGVSRASYFDIALHMRALKLTFQQAFDKVHAARPVANPNSGFVAHLQRLQPVLIGN